MASLGTVLVVDDEPRLRQAVVDILGQVTIDALQAGDATEALKLLRTRPVDVVLTDLRMPGQMDGMELLKQVHTEWEDVPIIMMTAHGTVSLAVDAMKNGAFDFLEKGFERDGLLHTVRKALDVANAAKRPPNTLPAPPDGGPFGESPKMVEVKQRLAKVAPTTASVLLLGENGTGKEVAARWLHQLSPRKSASFIAVNCAAIPENLFEGELFGHMKGAFTGADSDKPGRFEVADKGTLFLDEVGELPLSVQAKLLRALQEREIERLGSTKPIKVDVRVISATNRDLNEMVEKGTFRKDLLPRLCVVDVVMPPLRERGPDITALARRFAQDLAATNNRPKFRFLPDALELLQAQPWPGNVRELHNFVERMVVLAPADDVNATEVQKELSTGTVGSKGQAVAGAVGGALQSGVQQTEREMIVAAIKHCRGNKTLAAKMLQISRRTLYNKLAELGIRDDES
ncbi:MAG: sigma-54 dependent transcriptional regulator [Myxococcaceae bacterium]